MEKITNLEAQEPKKKEAPASYADTLKYHPVQLPCPKCHERTLEADNVGGFYLRCTSASCGWKGF
jgi:hypothetical protein